MGLREVQQELTADATRKSDAILEKAREEASAIIEKARKEASEIKELALKDAKSAAEENEKKEFAAAMLDAKKRLLAEEKRMMQEAIENVKSHLAKLRAEERKEILAKLLSRAEAELEIGKILCRKSDMAFFQGNVIEADISGGFTAENSDGTISMDFSFDALLEATAERHSQEFHKALLK